MRLSSIIILIIAIVMGLSGYTDDTQPVEQTIIDDANNDTSDNETKITTVPDDFVTADATTATNIYELTKDNSTNVQWRQVRYAYYNETAGWTTYYVINSACSRQYVPLNGRSIQAAEVLLDDATIYRLKCGDYLTLTGMGADGYLVYVKEVGNNQATFEFGFGDSIGSKYNDVFTLTPYNTYIQQTSLYNGGKKLTNFRFHIKDITNDTVTVQGVWLIDDCNPASGEWLARCTNNEWLTACSELASMPMQTKVIPAGIPVPHITRSTLYINYNTYLVGGDGHAVQVTKNSAARDPTYQEVVNFIRADDTDKHSYIPGEFVCIDFAENVQHNAEVAGYNCGFVDVEFTDSSDGHACNVFNTTDRGLVFIDCTAPAADTDPGNNDCYVILIPGCAYKPEYLYYSGGWYTESMGNVGSYKVFWD